MFCWSWSIHIYMTIQPIYDSLGQYIYIWQSNPAKPQCIGPQVHVVVYLTSAHTRPQQEKETEQKKQPQRQSDEGRSIRKKSILKEAELRNVIFFTQSKSFKPSFTPWKVRKSRQISHLNWMKLRYGYLKGKKYQIWLVKR